MSKLAIVAALEREVSHLTRNWSRVERQHQGRSFVFFEHDETVVVCGGIGVEATRRASEAVIALYHPALVQSVGFAGALDASLHAGDIFAPAVVIDARDGSRTAIKNDISTGEATLVTFMTVAGAEQKTKLAQAYGAQAVDMEAAAVAAAAQAHGIHFDAIKVISDDFNFEMPDMTRFIDSQGHFKTARFALHVTLRPWLWSRVATLSRNSRKAARALGAYLQEFQRTLSESSGKLMPPPAAAHPAAATVGAHRENR